MNQCNTVPHFPETDAGMRVWGEYLDEFPPGPTRGLQLSLTDWELVDRLVAGGFRPRTACCRPDAVWVDAGPEAMKWFLFRERVKLTPGVLGGTMVEFGG